MGAPVVIKGTKSGIIVVCEHDLSFDQCKEEVAKKFEESSKFLGNAQVAVTFQGQDFTDQQEIELMQCINEHSELDVVCIVEKDEKREAVFQEALNKKLTELETNKGQFYKGNLRSGQALEFQSSVVILGDVNAGAQVTSTGNIVILGALKGTVYAGASGNENAFVAALKMSPTQIRISDVIARAPDNETSKDAETKIAYLEDGNIYIEPLTRNTLGDIRI